MKEALNIFTNAEWIWAKDNNLPNDRVVFRRKFYLEKSPKSCIVRLACTGTYSLFVNGRAAIYDGGLGDVLGGYYYDEIDVTSLIKRGENAFAISVFDEYSNKNNSIFSGLIFECKQLNILSNSDFTVFRSGAYLQDGIKPPTAPYSAYNPFYDATRESQIDNIYSSSYESNIFVPANAYGKYPCEPYKTLQKRPIPLYKFSQSRRLKVAKKVSELNNDLYTFDLDYAGFFIPKIEVTAREGTQVIDIRSDRYKQYSSPIADGETVTNQRIQYVCKNGKQSYSSPIVLSGTKLVLTLPKSVKLNKASFIKSQFDFDMDGYFDCDNDTVNMLGDKLFTTISSCARDTLYSTPDRQRCLFSADASTIASFACATMSNSMTMLLYKCVKDYFDFSASTNILYSNPAHLNPQELPLANLITLSTRGLIARLYSFTGDKELLSSYYRQMASYLLTWNTDSSGMIIPKNGLCDLNYNIDKTLLETCIYYSACGFVLYAGKACSKFEFADELNERREKIAIRFNERFYKNGFYSSSSVFDERANAWAVISTLADKASYPQLARLISATSNCSPTFETYVADALCTMNMHKNALKRIQNRYFTMLQSPNPTLDEDFYAQGAQCNLSSGAVYDNFIRHFAGVTYHDGNKIIINPAMGGLKNIQYVVFSHGGGTIKGSYKVADDKTEIIIDNLSGIETELHLTPSKLNVSSQETTPVTIPLQKGKNKFSI